MALVKVVVATRLRFYRRTTSTQPASWLAVKPADIIPSLRSAGH